MSEPSDQNRRDDADDGLSEPSGAAGSVPEITDPDAVALPEPQLGDPVLSAEVEDDDVRSARAEASAVEGEAQRASDEVGGAPGAGRDLDVDPTAGPH
ncbi:hypothetical protein GCM10011512_04270 [Tersicoccus solisilvae]|uniref:Multidrug transporter n=1 Tax=Tersicoccus solisilvae TaxID=1882339 RepID=A0ABQ1NMC8_9MICC|nr:hypothetical protein [Tersicoccus solisilvae]GGC80658.1 hypothetical protein GCM10011512_04270 [Tersicoccus solisilvae]